MKPRSIRALPVVGILAMIGLLVPVQANAASVCTWAGTPAEPTGIFTIEPGLNMTPSAAPLKFFATGPLGGDCEGTFTFRGVLDAGATCAFNTFHGKARGLKGVKEFRGVGVTVLAPSGLLDKHDDVVAVEFPQILTGVGSGSEASDCTTPQGFSEGSFSSVIVGTF